MPRYLPPEWAPQAATLLIWPRADGDWGGQLPCVRNAIARMAAVLAARQRVILIAADAECRESIAIHPDLADAGPRVAELPNNDVWVRDTGPITVFADDGRRLFLDFRFDGWGGRHPSADDDALASRLYECGALGAGELIRQDWVLEGGAVETDGAGGLLATEGCLLHGRRNPGLGRAELETRLRDALGVKRILWLSEGRLEGDDTDGHIDTLARFAAPDHIVHQGCDDPDDEHHRPLTAMARELSALRTADGRPYRLTALPLPAPQYHDDRRLPAGYANFLLGNGVILAPAYDDPADAKAHALLADCFPDRELIPIDCRALIRQNGALHCAAMQIPSPMNHQGQVQ